MWKYSPIRENVIYHSNHLMNVMCVLVSADDGAQYAGTGWGWSGKRDATETQVCNTVTWVCHSVSEHCQPVTVRHPGHVRLPGWHDSWGRGCVEVPEVGIRPASATICKRWLLAVRQSSCSILGKMIWVTSQPVRLLEKYFNLPATCHVLRLSCVCDTAPRLAFSLVRDSAWRPGDKHGTAVHTASKPLWRHRCGLNSSSRDVFLPNCVHLNDLGMSQYYPASVLLHSNSVNIQSIDLSICSLLTPSVLNAPCCYRYLLCDVFKNPGISKDDCIKRLQTLLINSYKATTLQVNNIFLFQHLT